MRLCFAPLRLIPYRFYDDPIRNSSIAAGIELFDVQKATARYRKAAAGGNLVTRCGCNRRRAGGSGVSKDYQAGGRSNGTDAYLLLPSSRGQGPLPGH